MTRKTELSDWFEHSVDAGSRTLYLGGDIEAATAEFAIKGLHFLDKTPGDIFIKLSSWGGEWAEGMGIFDAIRTCSNQVTATVYGMAGSMGGIILQAADIRRMTPNSCLMVHYGSETISDEHSHNVTRQAEWNKRLELLMEDIFLKKIREKGPMTVGTFRKRFAFDTFFMPQEALDLGLCDEIWGSET